MLELPHRDVISVVEVARVTGEDLRTVQRKAARGVYPAMKMPGLRGAFLFKRDEIAAVLAERDEQQRAS